MNAQSLQSLRKPLDTNAQVMPLIVTTRPTGEFIHHIGEPLDAGAGSHAQRVEHLVCQKVAQTATRSVQPYVQDKLAARPWTQIPKEGFFFAPDKLGR